MSSIEDVLLEVQERVLKLENRISLYNAHPLYAQLHTRPDEITKACTGFLPYLVLYITFQVLQPIAEKMFSWSQTQRLRSKGIEEVVQLRVAIRSCKLNLFQQFYFFLDKLRLGSFNQELADKLKISISTVSRLFFLGQISCILCLIPCQFGPQGKKSRNTCQSVLNKSIQGVEESLMFQKSRQRHHHV